MKFHPFVFFVTSYERAGRHLWEQAMMEPKRLMKVPKKVTKLKLKKQVPFLSYAIRHNHSVSKGKAEYFGAITGYKYFYTPKKCLVFDTDGSLLDKRKESLPEIAILQVGDSFLTIEK